MNLYEELEPVVNMTQAFTEQLERVTVEKLNLIGRKLYEDFSTLPEGASGYEIARSQQMLKIAKELKSIRNEGRTTRQQLDNLEKMGVRVRFENINRVPDVYHDGSQVISRMAIPRVVVELIEVLGVE